MPIAPLPETTVRAIGSSQVLTDAASAVKELVDNALDARASSIVVEISSNALDVIQVKDNGHGIAPEDRALICQRSCTSKIRDFSDVSRIGGTSLGFRGEALASAVEMSGSVVVTTRVEGEPVATSRIFDRSGKLVSQDSVSHPMGTTVRIIDFLKYMPVRKQVALKTTAKVSSKIKHVLKAYALARPLVRLSLKVLKAKNDKDNWMYASKAGATVTDAAMKVFNQRAVAECAWNVWSTDSRLEHKTTATSPSADVVKAADFEYTIEALLPRKHCDTAAISNLGQYLSIDSRPVSCTRGTLKEIVNSYKSYLKSASSIASHEKLIDPFLCLNICCPPGSYDPNLEPAKDNALFTDAKGLMRMIEKFFAHVYGEKKVVASQDTISRHLADQEEEFDLLLNRKSRLPQHDVGSSSHRGRSKSPTIAQSSTTAPDEDLFLEGPLHPQARMKRQPVPYTTAVLTDPADRLQSATPSLEEQLPRRRAWKSTMYHGDEDDDIVFEDVGEVHCDMLEEDDELMARDITLNNPWTIAKMNASIEPRILVPKPQKFGAVEKHGQPLTPARSGSERNARGDPEDEYCLASSPTVSGSRTPVYLPSPASTLPSAQESSSPTRLPFSTNPWARHRNSMAATGTVDLQEEGNDLGAVNGHIRTVANASASGFVSARTLPTGTPLANIPDVSQRPRKQQQGKQGWQQRQGAGLLKPFVPPIKRSQRAWSEVVPTQQHPRAHNQQPHRTTDDLENRPILGQEREALGQMEGRSSMRPSSSMHTDLAVTMDFESRKEAAMQKRRSQLQQQTIDQLLHRSTEPQSGLSTISTSPHKNRFNKAIAALNSTEEPLKHHKSPFKKGDPRHHLARDLQAEDRDEQKDNSPQSHTLKRRKTAHMPFENILIGEAVHNLTITVDTSKRNLIDEGTKLAEHDEYIRSGKQPDGFDCTVEEARSWNTLLQDLIESRLEKEHGHTQGVCFDLWALLQPHAMSREESGSHPAIMHSG